jgi:hypothetical protein
MVVYDDLPTDDVERIHAIIDVAARRASEPFLRARSDTAQETLTRLAHRIERTVRLSAYEYLNDRELSHDAAADLS